MTERQPTPLEVRIMGASALALGICESFAVHSMVTSAIAVEKDYAKLGKGVPPLHTTTDIHLMWADVADFASAEA